MRTHERFASAEFRDRHDKDWTGRFETPPQALRVLFGKQARCIMAEEF
jgi:hypothetical protein